MDTRQPGPCTFFNRLRGRECGAPGTVLIEHRDNGKVVKQFWLCAHCAQQYWRWPRKEPWYRDSLHVTYTERNAFDNGVRVLEDHGL